jgi:beta-lactamase class A
LLASAAAADDFTRTIDDFVRPLGGELGFAMLHVERRERVALRGAERFAMFSVYKLPIAMAVLHAVDTRRLSLEQPVRLTAADVRLGPGRNEVAELVGAAGCDFSVRELLRRALVDSDSACSDALLRLVGAREVNQRLAALGVQGMRVDRSELELQFDFAGVSHEPPPGGWTLERMHERYRSASPRQRTQALAALSRDPRDTTTPDAMADLLLRVHQGRALQPGSSALLLKLLADCKTGANRLRGRWPAEVPFLHRTGSSGTTDGVTAATNDAGVVPLPGGRGHVILAAFLRNCRGSMAEREAALAAIGHAVFARYAAG